MIQETSTSQARRHILVVNERDEVIGTRLRGEEQPEDIYRVSSLWITNLEGKILLVQRSFKKDKDPGKWSGAVSGTVDVGEDYDDNIVKEAKEELGLFISIADLRRGPKLFLHGRNRFFCQWYFLTTSETKFTLQEDEVAGFRWISKEDLRKEFAAHPERFAKTAREWLPQMLEAN